MTPLCDDPVTYITDMVRRGGPQPNEYDHLTQFFDSIHAAAKRRTLSTEQLGRLMDAFGEAMGLETVQGFAYRKPHGYAGDFEILDRVYNRWVSPHAHLANWDRYFHSLPAPKAVRNRIPYLHRLLDEAVRRNPNAHILDVGSGSCRSLFEWLECHPDSEAQFDCIEVDPKAIAFASKLCHAHIRRIKFQQRNVFQYQPDNRYDLIWSAGLFDYFDDAVFVSVGRRLLTALTPDGELVAGNFAPGNPQRAYMETIGGWSLHLRSAEELVALMARCGATAERVHIGTEPEGVNLFAHVRGGP